MIFIYPDQLLEKLNKSLNLCYLLFGNDILFLQESQDYIRSQAKNKKFSEYLNIVLDHHTDWNSIFSLCTTSSLFSTRQILSLTLPENGVNITLSEKLILLSSLLNNNFLLILRGNPLNKIQKNSTWFKAFNNNSVYVNCITPNHEQLPFWIKNRIKSIKISLDEESIQLLCYFYEGNLIALSQILNRLSLIYPDEKLTLSQVKGLIYDVSYFTPFDWIDAVLSGKNNRARHILRKLQIDGIEPIILLRNIQREILLLLNLKKKIKTTEISILFDQYKIWKYRQFLLTQALERLSIQQLKKIILLMIKIEFLIKRDYKYSPWNELYSLILLLCNKQLPTSMISD